MPSALVLVECPNCGTFNSTVTCGRRTPINGRVRRRRCHECSHGWYTYQSPETNVPDESVYWGERLMYYDEEPDDDLRLKEPLNA
jgi:transcriptional regulator NrdR family protein